MSSSTLDDCRCFPSLFHFCFLIVRYRLAAAAVALAALNAAFVVGILIVAAVVAATSTLASALRRFSARRRSISNRCHDVEDVDQHC